MKSKTITILHKVRQWSFLFLCLTAISFTNTSCIKEEEPKEDSKQAECLKTLFMYFPYSGNLTSFFRTNIADMEECISKQGLENKRVVVFFSSSSSAASLFEIVCKNGVCERQTLKEYSNPPFTTAAGIASILNDLKEFAPAKTYAMTIGCHGMGWIPVHSQGKIRSMNNFLKTDEGKPYWESEGLPLTRWFGGTSDAYRTDISTLAQGIRDADMTMEFILFDDCYMSSIEVAYDLREVTGYLIGSTSEIMSYGMPYAVIGEHLLDTDYEAICEEFYEFYFDYDYPYGTIGVTDCSELDELAAIMREINGRYSFDDTLRGELQRLDGPRYMLFYDYGDYVRHLCADTNLLEAFDRQLARAVPYKRHTGAYPYASGNTVESLPIHTFSGITTSDPCDVAHNTWITEADRENTNWYKATH